MNVNIADKETGTSTASVADKSTELQSVPKIPSVLCGVDENINPAMQSWQQRVLKQFYYGRNGWIDGTTEFHNLVGRFLGRGKSILEVGAGPPNDTTAFLANLGDVTGIDVDTAVFNNHYCKKTIVYDGVRIPCYSAQYDAVIAHFVCEHIEHPLELTREIRRILKPGGIYLLKTPNIWHYAVLISKLSPSWFHFLAANRLRHLAADHHEPYKTFYRMNTAKACRRVLSESGFSIVTLKHIEKEPSYGMASRLMFYPLLMWERLINSTCALEFLRSNILCAARADV